MNNFVLLTFYDYLAFPSYSKIVPKMSDYNFYVINLRLSKDHNNFSYSHFENVKEVINVYLILDHQRNQKGLYKKFRTKFSNLREYKKTKDKIYSYLEEIKPVGILSTSDKSYIDILASMWSKKANIPFFILQPAFIEGFLKKLVEPTFLYKIKYHFFKFISLPIYSKNNFYGFENEKDILFLWSKKFLLKPNRSNTYYIGNPAFDDLILMPKDIPPKNNTILICTEVLETLYDESVNKLIYQGYLNLIEHFKEIKFIIKPHPREKISFKNIFSTDKYINISIINNENLYDLFNKSDIQISVNSFTGFEAIVKGIPIINFIPTQIKNKNLLIYTNDVNFLVEKPENLIKAVNKILTNDYWNVFLKNREKFLSSVLEITDGTSTETMLKIIRHLIETD